MKLLVLLHVLATVVWVGGMFFAHMCLRPVVSALFEPPQRLPLLRCVFARFFPWVWASVALLVVSGQIMSAQMGGMANVPVHVHVMAGIGYLMAGIFAYIWFVPFKALGAAVNTRDWPVAGAAVARIRVLVATNLVLGLLNIVLVFLLPMLGV